VEGEVVVTTGLAPAAVNPYVGPRAFVYGERLYGRDFEVRELLDLVIAERIVLLYSPSGAGKSSILQAGLVPALEAEGFSVAPVIRVGREPSPAVADDPAVNRYRLSTMLSLEQGFPADEQLAEGVLAAMTLAAYLELLETRGGPWGGDELRCLVFDQFEELVTADPVDEPAKAAFVHELADVLRDRTRFALFAIREDYLAQLDPYALRLPTRLRTGYRLDLLREGAAMLAIRGPAEATGVEVSSDVVAQLVDDLRRVRHQQGSSTVERLGHHVEPVQLQVVCHRMWTRRDQGSQSITELDRPQLGDVDAALADYYEERILRAAESTGVTERALRAWFNDELITDQGFRAQVLSGPAGDDDGRAVATLEAAHLVRGEMSRGVRWYELAHDRLVEPIRSANAAWRATHLSLVEREATVWDEQSRPDGLLLDGDVLAAAEQWAAANPALDRRERDFIEASRRQQDHRLRERAAARRHRIVARVATAVSVVAVLALVTALVLWREADDAKARTNQTEAAYRWLALARHPDAGPSQGVLGALEAAEVYGPTRKRRLPNDLLQGLWEETYAVGRSSRRVTFFSLSPDGSSVAMGGTDGSVRIVDIADRHTLAEFRASDPVRNIEFSPAGDALAVVTVADEEATLTLWRIPSGGGKPEPTRLPPAPANRNDSYTLLFDPTGRTVGVTDEQTSFTTWDVRTRTVLEQQGEGEAVGLRAIGPDGVLATADASGNVVIRQPGRASQPLDDVSGLYRMVFSPNGRSFAAAGTGSIVIWNDGFEAPTEVPVDFAPAALTFAADDGRLHWLDELCNVGSVDPYAADPEATIAETMLSCYGYPAGLFDANAERVATLTDSGLEVWATTGEEFAPPLFGSEVLAGRGEAVVAAGGVSAVIDAGVALVRDKRGDLQWSIEATTIAMSDDGRRLATYSDSSAEVRMYDIGTGDMVSSIEIAAQPFALAVDDDGARVVIVGFDETATLWDVDTGRQHDLPLESRPEGVYVESAAIDPERARVALGFTDGIVAIVDGETGEWTATLEGATTAWIAALDFDDRGDSVAIADSTGQILRWSGRDRAEAEPVGSAGGLVNALDWANGDLAVATARGQLNFGAAPSSVLTMWAGADPSSEPLQEIRVFSDDVLGVAIDGSSGRVTTIEADGFVHSIAWDPYGVDAVEAAHELDKRYGWEPLDEGDCDRLIHGACPLRG
jgi:WD40 repeat protein